MTTVLAAVDSTDAARSVLATTSAICRVLHTDAHAIHVGPDPADAATYAAELSIPLTVVHGDATSQIVAAARRDDVELLVLALNGLPGRHAPGHTARAVATALPKPVLVVPPEAPVRAAPSRVLMPLDGTQSVSVGLRPLISRYTAAGVEVVVLHVFNAKTVPRFFDGAEDALVWRSEFLAKHCAELGLRLETRPGPTVSSVLEVAAEEDVDVIALGWHQLLSERRARVVQEVLRAADRPIALVPVPTATTPS